MKIINVLGGPATGKSAVAAELFARLKNSNFNVELYVEISKDVLSQTNSDQLFLLAVQNQRIEFLKGCGVEYLITDSPLIMQPIYHDPKRLSQDLFEKLVLELHYKNDNLNFFLERSEDPPYLETGRLSVSESEAKKCDDKLLNKLDELGIDYQKFSCNSKLIDKLIEAVYIDALKKER